MHEHGIRRISIVDAEDRVIEIVFLADLALRDKPGRVSKTVAEISRPTQPSIAAEDKNHGGRHAAVVAFVSDSSLERVAQGELKRALATRAEELSCGAERLVELG